MRRLKRLGRANRLLLITAVVMAMPIVAVVPPVHAEVLEAYSQNLNDCIETLPASIALEKKLSFCKARRARSLIFSHDDCIQPSSQVNYGCQLADSAELNGIALVADEVNLLRPLKRQQMFKAFQGATFRYDGKQYRVAVKPNGQNELQQRSGDAWVDYCTLSMSSVGYSCLKASGRNGRGGIGNSRIECSYASTRFALHLTHLLVTERTSRRTVQPGPMHSHIFSCAVDADTAAVAWS